MLKCVFLLCFFVLLNQQKSYTPIKICVECAKCKSVHRGRVFIFTLTHRRLITTSADWQGGRECSVLTVWYQQKQTGSSSNGPFWGQKEIINLNPVKSESHSHSACYHEHSWSSQNEIVKWGWGHHEETAHSLRALPFHLSAKIVEEYSSVWFFF